MCGNSSIGLQDGRIPDVSFTASSSKNTNLPHMARLNGPKSWMPYDGDKNKYLQIDLAPHRYVLNIITASGDPASGAVPSFYKVVYKERNDEKWKRIGVDKSGEFAETVSTPSRSVCMCVAINIAKY